MSIKSRDGHCNSHLTGSELVDMYRRPLWIEGDPIARMRKLCIDHRSSENWKHSPLLRLPSELRIAIYQYVFGGQEVIVRRKQSLHYPFSWRLFIYTGPLDHVKTVDLDLFTSEDAALRRTCRQTLQETMGMWFAGNTFQGRSDAVEAFIKHPKTRTSYIHSIRLRFDTVISKGAIPVDPFSLTAEPKDVLIALRPLKRLRMIPITLPESEMPTALIEHAVLAEMRRVLEQDREGQHVQIVMESFGSEGRIRATKSDQQIG